MKFILLSFFISLSALGSNWMPLEKISEKSSQAYQLESDCLRLSLPPQPCLDVGDEPGMLTAGFISLVNDWGPESEEEVCDGQSDCESKLEEKVCPGVLQKFISANFTKVYCVELLGKKLLKDSVGWSSHKAGLAAQAQLEAGLAMARKLRECGGRAMDLMLVRNQPKGLSVPQVALLLETYAPIQLQLSSGSLVTAKTAIQAVAADGVIVTEGDKSALVSEIDKCLGL